MTFWNNRVEPQEEESELSPYEIEQMTGSGRSSNINEAEEFVEEQIRPKQRYMSPALLRLEQGKLYQMLIEHDLFSDVDANPQAVENVQRELKDFITSRLEIMLGMRSEGEVVKTVESSVFSNEEVDALKTLAKKMNEGLSKKIEQPKTGNLSPVGAEKAKAMLNTIKKPQENKPLQKTAPKTVVKAKPEPRPIPKDFSKKKPEELTEQDFIERNRQINTKIARPESAIPLPQLTADQSMLHYQTIQAQNPQQSQLVNAVLNAKTLMSKK